MDMSCIKGKLDKGEYTDPWEFVDDVWLMFENAWVYNRKTSRVYKWCSKVRDFKNQVIVYGGVIMTRIFFPSVCSWQRYLKRT